MERQSTKVLHVTKRLTLDLSLFLLQESTETARTQKNRFVRYIVKNFVDWLKNVQTIHSSDEEIEPSSSHCSQNTDSYDGETDPSRSYCSSDTDTLENTNKEMYRLLSRVKKHTSGDNSFHREMCTPSDTLSNRTTRYKCSDDTMDMSSLRYSIDSD